MTVTLTARQRRVVHLLAQGYGQEAVAVELGVAPRTVKAYADTLREKLGVEHRREIPSAYRRLTGDDPFLSEGETT